MLNSQENIIGNRYRKLVVIKLVESVRANKYLCQCDCGNTIIASLGQLNARTGSCGCRKKPFKVSETYKRLRSVWKGMIRRCHNKTHKAYMSYGGRGITVCEHWHTFINFYNDMKESYQQGLQLDRIENNGIYCKENCRWVTRKINMRNRRDVKLTQADVDNIRISNKTTIELGKIYNIDPSVISRIKNNISWAV